MRYNGQDNRYHTQHGNNSHDRSEYVRQDHTSNTWRNSGGRGTSVTPEMYTEHMDENKTYDSYTTQYMDRYAQHMELKKLMFVNPPLFQITERQLSLCVLLMYVDYIVN